MASLPYHEPGITTILSLISFILALNGSRYVLDRLLCCGLLGEIFIGVVWGAPLGGTAWLTAANQETVQSFGYLGLIGLVFEGGMNTSLSGLRETAIMSISIATIGLCVPIGLSFLLLVFPIFDGTTSMAHPSPLAAFSAGASLCSTSLGTTFAILSAAGLQKTKIGVVLVGAAMMDDVVGLVMVKIVTALGSGDFTAWGVARPIVSSFALFVVTIALTPYVIRPSLEWTLRWARKDREPGNVEKSGMQKLMNMAKSTFRQLHLHFILATLALIAFVTIAAYIDASILFAAFIAGGFVQAISGGSESRNASIGGEDTAQICTNLYDQYYRPVIAYILAPFFFASIGFAIPIREMFDGAVVWKGVTYAVMMMVAKVAVGVAVYGDYLVRKLRQTARHGQSRTTPPEKAPHIPAAIIALAMVARGEIGFLIASLSSSAGTLTVRSAASTNPDTAATSQGVFLVIIWAVVLCTLLGPVGVGITVRKLMHSQRNSSDASASEVRMLVLGRWA